MIMCVGYQKEKESGFAYLVGSLGAREDSFEVERASRCMCGGELEENVGIAVCVGLFMQSLVEKKCRRY